MIDDYGKGQLPDPHDARDYQYAAIAAAPSVDWSKEVRLPTPPDTDQGVADCCVGESSSSLHWQLKQKQFAVRSIFAYIALSYGAYIRDGVLRIRNFGQQLFSEVPDPNPKTPTNMRETSGLNPTAALTYKEFDAYSLSSIDMNVWADALTKYNGFIFGLQGTNEGWQNGLVPEPPKAGDYNIAGKVWGHALYAMGYHTHTNTDGSQERCIIAKSSWCNWVKEHHIRERYFNAGGTNSAWVLIPQGAKPMYQLVRYADGKTWGVLVKSPNGDFIIKVNDGEQEYRSLSNVNPGYGLPTVNADGSTNWNAPYIQLPW